MLAGYMGMQEKASGTSATVVLDIKVDSDGDIKIDGRWHKFESKKEEILAKILLFPPRGVFGGWSSILAGEKFFWRRPPGRRRRSENEKEKTSHHRKRNH